MLFIGDEIATTNGLLRWFAWTWNVWVKLTAPDTALKAMAYMYEKSIDDLRKKLRCHKGSSTTALANVI